MQYFLYTETRWALGRWKFMVMGRGSFQTVATAMAFHAFTLAFVRFGCTRKKNLQKSETRIFTQIRRSLFAVHSIRFFFFALNGYLFYVDTSVDRYVRQRLLGWHKHIERMTFECNWCNDERFLFAVGIWTFYAGKSITSNDDVQLKESFEAVLKSFYARQYIED